MAPGGVKRGVVLKREPFSPRECYTFPLRRPAHEGPTRAQAKVRGIPHPDRSDTPPGSTRFLAR